MYGGGQIHHGYVAYVTTTSSSEPDLGLSSRATPTDRHLAQTDDAIGYGIESEPCNVHV
jgi:hypothetical protein